MPTFTFEYGFECIDEALQEIKISIFSMPDEPVAWVQLYWSTQLCHALECYNVTIEEGKEDPRNINIHESEGQCEVRRPKAKVPNILQPLKTKPVNIGSEVQPKFENIGDYWDEDTMEKVVEILWEYQDLFPKKFSDLKGITGDLGIMKMTLMLDVKLVK